MDSAGGFFDKTGSFADKPPGIKKPGPCSPGKPLLLL